jgi:hypothetical protein
MQVKMCIKLQQNSTQQQDKGLGRLQLLCVWDLAPKVLIAALARAV